MYLTFVTWHDRVTHARYDRVNHARHDRVTHARHDRVTHARANGVNKRMDATTGSDAGIGDTAAGDTRGLPHGTQL